MRAKTGSLRYASEVREWAVRLEFDYAHEYTTPWAAIQSIADKFGFTAETLRGWIGNRNTTKGDEPESLPMNVNG